MKSCVEKFAAGFVFAVSLIATSLVGVSASSAEELTIVSGDVSHKFNVEVVSSDAARAKGLMFRRRMAADAGMLFDFQREQPISMWMRNTYISLDMIFAYKNGTIHRIAEHTEPHSEKTITSGEDVRYVLEINGGMAGKLKLAPGDRIEHPLIGN